MAIVIPSFGKRPWVERCAETFSHYAAACGATLHVERDVPSASEFPFPKLSDKPGRKMKLAYACKAYLAWRYMEKAGYDRVAIVDDTCAVRAGTPNVFDAVPWGFCGYTRTSDSHAEESFATIRQFVQESGLPAVPFDSQRYMNSGFMVYDRTMVAALHPDKICACAPLLFAHFPNQTLTYYLLASAGVQQHELPKAYNTMPALSLPAEERKTLADIVPHIQPGVFIYHLSAFYGERRKLLRQLTDLFLAEWRALEQTTKR